MRRLGLMAGLILGLAACSDSGTSSSSGGDSGATAGASASSSSGGTAAGTGSGSTASSSSGSSAASTSTGGASDSGGTSSSSGASSSSGGTTGTTLTPVNGCDPATAEDHTADSNVTITFPTGAAPAQYSPACIKISANATVTFSGGFSHHPLQPDGTGNPITATNTGTSAQFTFANAGSYGFHCQFHPSVMLGAVYVQ